MAAKEYVVTAPYVTIKLRDANTGAWVLYGRYQGATFSGDDIEPAPLQHHLDSDLVAEKGSDQARQAEETVLNPPLVQAAQLEAAGVSQPSEPQPQPKTAQASPKSDERPLTSAEVAAAQKSSSAQSSASGSQSRQADKR